MQNHVFPCSYFDRKSRSFLGSTFYQFREEEKEGQALGPFGIETWLPYQQR